MCVRVCVCLCVCKREDRDIRVFRAYRGEHENTDIWQVTCECVSTGESACARKHAPGLPYWSDYFSKHVKEV